MTELLEKVFKKASILPEYMQDMLAREFLQKMEWEEKWDITLKNTQTALDKLTLKAMKQYREGKTKEMERLAVVEEQ
ncbi:MAG: hypothetical protein HQK65_09800 [Desulfamplus sp.]|nr:hypothetical protein [Desulfamplus sp.]